VINPDSIIKQYGADSLRMFEMFLGPLAFSKPWNSQGIIGIYRFLNRVWDLIVNSHDDKKDGLIMTKEARKKLKADLEELERHRHQMIKKVTEDIENFHFNTAISSLMEYTNKISEIPTTYLDSKYLDTLVLLLSPFAPHLSEELWHQYLHHRGLASATSWPHYNKKLTEEKELTLIIQVNGKTRGTIKIKKGISQNQAQKLATPIIKKYLDKRKIKKIIFVENKLINFVIKS
jgi:leucyl-tRNA synthetase